MFGEKIHQKLREFVLVSNNILDGYENGDVNPSNLVKSMSKILQDPQLPILEFHEIIASISCKVPSSLYQSLIGAVETVREFKLDMKDIDELIVADLIKLSLEEQASLSSVLEPIYVWTRKYRRGIEDNFQVIFIALLTKYYNTQVLFEGFSDADAMARLRAKFKLNLDKVVEISLSSSKKVYSNNLVIALLENIQAECSDKDLAVFLPIIEKLAALTSARTSKVSFRSRELLIASQQPSFFERQNTMLNILKSATSCTSSLNSLNFDQNQLAQLVMSPNAISHLLAGLFYHKEKNVCAASLYTYISHTYQSYYSIVKMCLPF
jgi:acetyl-CoA carboxylase/biotin carboxylase 1